MSSMQERRQLSGEGQFDENMSCWNPIYLFGGFFLGEYCFRVQFQFEMYFCFNSFFVSDELFPYNLFLLQINYKHFPLSAPFPFFELIIKF